MNGRKCGQRPAFSLVELMVSVTIIALLITIMVPSVAAARRQARRVACAAHLHGLGLGWETYAAEWGSLPMMARRAGDINLHAFTGRILERRGKRDLREMMLLRGNWAPADFRFLIFQVDLSGLGRPGPEFPGRWRNWGLLYKSGVVRAEESFYCPSQRDPFLSHKTYLNPWPPRAETAILPDGSANHTQSSYERRLGLSHVPWERVGLRTVVATDVLDSGNIGQTHGHGVNALFRDGHASYVRHPRLMELVGRLDSYSAITDAWKRDILALYDWLDGRY